MANEKQMCAELESNCTKNNERLLELMKTYELAKLGNEVQIQAFNDIHNEVLAKNEFYCKSGEYERVGVKKGDRITDAKGMWTLEECDFNKVMELALPLQVERGLTDDKGYYITNWLTIVIGAKNELVNFIIDNILPKSLREGFEKARTSIVYQDKLLDIIYKQFKTKEQ
jgi:hypothetical protein